MDILNAGLTRATDWLLGLTSSWPPLATLVLWSAVAGVLMAIVFRFTSNQRGLKLAADRSRAQVLAIKLFGHDLRAMFVSLGQLLRYTGLRLWYSLPPMLVMLVPFVLLLTQLAARFEYRPIAPGGRTIVRLELDEKDWPKNQRVALVAPAAVEVETPALRDAAEHAVYWRVRVKDAEPASLEWNVNGAPLEKRIDIARNADSLVTVSTRRPGRGIFDRLLHPAEPAVASDSPVRGIVIEYAPRQTAIFGYDVPWWLTFFVVSIVAALAVRPWVKVRF